MTVVKPTTLWIRDNGTVLTESTSLLVDESANLFVDESGNNLKDSQSSDGANPLASWAESL